MRQDLIEQKRRRAACCVLLVKVRGYGKDGGTMEGDEDEGGEGLAGMVYRRRAAVTAAAAKLAINSSRRRGRIRRTNAASLRQP